MTREVPPPGDPWGWEVGKEVLPMKKGTWKKERAVGRKYSGGDQEAKPKPHARKKYWVGGYHRKRTRVSESWRRNPNYRKRKGK